jgi:hypothetical protein
VRRRRVPLRVAERRFLADLREYQKSFPREAAAKREKPLAAEPAAPSSGASCALAW